MMCIDDDVACWILGREFADFLSRGIDSAASDRGDEGNIARVRGISENSKAKRTVCTVGKGQCPPLLPFRVHTGFQINFKTNPKPCASRVRTKKTLVSYAEKKTARPRRKHTVKLTGKRNKSARKRRPPRENITVERQCLSTPPPRSNGVRAGRSFKPFRPFYSYGRS